MSDETTSGPAEPVPPPFGARRDLLRTLGLGGAGAVLAASPWREAMAGGTSGATPVTSGAMTPWQRAYFRREEPFFQRFAERFSLDPAVSYFMAAQKGSMPDRVRRTYKAENLDRVAFDPFPVYPESVGGDPLTIREACALALETTVDSVALAQNTTDALCQILLGLPWERGDEILTTPHEHPAGIAPIERLALRFGVRIRLAGLPVGADVTPNELLRSIRRQIRPGRTKVLAVSSPVWPTGTILPLRALAELCQSYDIVTVADGAQMFGHGALKADALGFDFWALAGHKWQCGPGGTGVLYARNQRTRGNPAAPPRFYPTRSSSLTGLTDFGRRGYDIGDVLSRYGFQEAGHMLAMGDAVRLWNEIGRERIETWIFTLGDYLKNRIVDTFGVKALISPRHPELRSGITAFNPFPTRAQRRDATLNATFRTRLLEEYGIRISGGALGGGGFQSSPDLDPTAIIPGTLPNLDPISGAPISGDIPNRVNSCVWNDVAEVDTFIAAVQDLVGQMA